MKLFHANVLKKFVERNSIENIAVLGAAIIEERQDLDMGGITEYVSEKKEDYTQVSVNPDLTTDQKDQVLKVLVEFQDVFSDVPNVTTLGEHTVQLTSTEPIRSKAYPLPFALRESVGKELNFMLASVVIEPSTAPYASPIVVVKKPDGNNRICVDFRKLNKVMIFDPEPMPQKMQDIFAELS